MRASILQHVDVAVGVAGDEDLIGGEPRADEVARLAKLAFMGDVDPQPAEDALLLELKHGRVRVSPTVYVVGANQPADVIECQRRGRLFHAMFHAA